MGIPGAVYGWYANRLRARVVTGPLPQHVAVIIDGNRRWARQRKLDNVSLGHRHGLEHIERLLGWCADLGIDQVSIFVLSLDNLGKRPPAEVDFLTGLAGPALRRLSEADREWRVTLAGRPDALPADMVHTLKHAEEITRDRHRQLTLAVGYDGRAEIVDAVRSLLEVEARAGTSIEDLAGRVHADDIAAHLYLPDLPEPDLIIRTSGERRLSGFLTWQSTRSELFFCDVYWPGFRWIDFLRTVRAFVARRHGARG